MLSLLVIAVMIGAPEPERLPGPPRPKTAASLVAVGEDGRLGVMVTGAALVTWDIATGKKRLLAKLPAERWKTLALAPRTDGENERAIVASDRRIALVHLRTGRRIGDWSVGTAWAASRAVTWTPAGDRVGLVGYELEELIKGDGVPVLWVDAETGTVVSQLRIPELPVINGAAALGDGRRIALGSPRRIVVLGPGPTDAKTIGVDHDRVVGATRDGIVILKKGMLAVIDQDSGTKGKELARVKAPADIEGDIAMQPAGRWAIARARGGVFVIDLATSRVMTLSQAALGSTTTVLPSLGGIVAVGPKVMRLDLAGGVPEALLLQHMCTRGDCIRGEGAKIDLFTGRQYTGTFRGGEPNGQGTLRYEDGAIYTGPFVRGQPHGAGKVLSPAGDERRVNAVHGELRPAP